MTVLIIVNGPPGDADALRAEAFAARLPASWTIHVRHRPSRGVGGVVQLIRAVVEIRPDVTYVVKCAFAGVIAAWLGRLLVGCPYVCDTGDAMYALARSSGRYSAAGLMLVWLVEFLGVRRSDARVVRGSEHKRLLKQMGLSDVTFVPDGVDRAEQPSQAGQAVRTELNLSGRFTVGLVGSMDWSDRHAMCYGWDIVEALPLLVDLPVSALLVGDGTGLARLKKRAETLGVSDSVRFAGRQPYHRLGDFLAAMDVCVSTQSADVVGQVRTTGKLPLYLAHGKHVIATEVGEARRVLAGLGSLMPYHGVRDDDHPPRLAAKIRELQRQPERLAHPAECRRVAAAEFDYDLLADRVRNVCEAVARRDRKRRRI